MGIMTQVEALPEVTPCVLFKRIVPFLRSQGWEITRGRRLEEGDRIYRPGCKAKGRLAKRNEDFFICYDGYNTNQALVDHIFNKGILIPQQVWTPDELSTQDLALKPELPTETENVAQVANRAIAVITAQSHQKKKRTAASKENEAGGNDNRAPKRHKKTMKKKKKQRPLHVLHTQNATVSPTESGVTVGGSSTEVGSVQSESTVGSEPQTRDASEFGMQLLQEVKLIMLDFVTVVNRRWRPIKDAAHSSWPNGGQSDEVAALTTDIHESRHDLTCEIQDVVDWMRNYSCSSVKVGAQKIQLPRFESGSSELPQLLRGVKLFVQQLVVVVRRYRRSLCAVRGITASRPTSGANRREEVESMASTIAVLQDDLRDGLNEMTATVSYDSEKTDTDDET